MPHDTMSYLRAEISEGTSGMTVRLSPFFYSFVFTQTSEGNHRNNFCVSDKSLKGKARARGRIGSTPSLRVQQK